MMSPRSFMYALLNFLPTKSLFLQIPHSRNAPARLYAELEMAKSSVSCLPGRRPDLLARCWASRACLEVEALGTPSSSRISFPSELPSLSSLQA